MSKRQVERSWSTGSPDARWDYIVVGSGMGGMTTAALLAKLGKRVLVLEQHYVPGGFTHTFKRKGWVWDVGVHAVGEVTEHTMTGRVLAALTDGRLEWTSLGPVYDAFHYPDDVHIDFPDDPKRFRANLIAAFPAQVEAIDAYLALIKQTAKSMRGFLLSRALPPLAAWLTDRVVAGAGLEALRRRTADVMAEVAPDARLRTALLAQWGYYGSPPSRSAFAMHALTARHFAHGGYYPVGGSGRIAETLLKTVADAGGWTRIKASVKRIVVSKGRAAGVELDDGEIIRAGKVVSAIGALETVERLLPAEYHDAGWSKAIGALTPSPAHLCLNLGFEGDIRQAGASAANQWFYSTWDVENEVWRAYEIDDVPAPVLYTSFPSLKDPAHDPGPKQRHTGEVVTFMPLEDFEPWRGSRWMKRGEDYDSFKRRLTDRLLEQIFAQMPGLEPLTVHAELSTPLSTEHFTRSAGGAIYGLEPSVERYANRWLRARTPVGGLFLSGVDVASVGVIGAMVGGVLAALSAEPLAAGRYLKSAAAGR